MQPQDGNYYRPTDPSQTPDSPTAMPQAQPPAPVGPQPSAVEDTSLQPLAPVGVAAEQQVSDSGQPLSWQASEFIHHEKNGTWFAAVTGVAIILLAIALLTRSWTFAFLIVVMAAAIFVVGRRPPRSLNYSLTSSSIHIDDKTFAFPEFRAFGIVQEDAFYSVRLIPNKRFMPMVSVYFPPELGEQIVDILGATLPMEQLEQDPIEKLVQKIRF